MENIEINTGLSSADFRLYDFLKKQGNNWILQKDIALALPEVFPCTIGDMEDFHNSTARHMITDSIRRLNESGYVHKVILSSGKGVKIATEEEFDVYIGSNINAVIRRLKRLKGLAQKADKNNQYRLKMSEYQKDVYNAFID